MPVSIFDAFFLEILKEVLPENNLDIQSIFVGQASPIQICRWQEANNHP
jgi:hypothetical protein